MELRLPSSGGPNVMHARQPRNQSNALLFAGIHLLSGQVNVLIRQQSGVEMDICKLLQELTAHRWYCCSRDGVADAAREPAIRFHQRTIARAV